MSELDWWGDADCTKMNNAGEIFMPAQGDHVALEIARTVCATCAVQEPCKEYGIANPRMPGVFGGLSWNQRRKAAQHRPEINPYDPGGDIT